MIGTPRYYDDVEIGDNIGPVNRTITGEQVRQFVGVWVSGRDTTRFTGDETVKEHGQPAPIVPGPMNMAVVAQLLTGWSSNVTVRKVDIIFRQMVLHDMPLSVGGVVTDKRLNDGVPEIQSDVFIDDVENNRLVMGNVVVRLPMRRGP
jgi:hypothetical protein